MNLACSQETDSFIIINLTRKDVYIPVVVDAF